MKCISPGLYYSECRFLSFFIESSDIIDCQGGCLLISVRQLVAWCSYIYHEYLYGLMSTRPGWVRQRPVGAAIQAYCRRTVTWDVISSCDQVFLLTIACGKLHAQGSSSTLWNFYGACAWPFFKKEMKVAILGPAPVMHWFTWSCGPSLGGADRWSETSLIAFYQLFKVL